MSRVDIPTQDSLYGPWITVFASVATANITALGMTSGQASTLSGLATAFQNSWEDSNAKKAAAKGAVTTKDNMRAASEAAFRATAKTINSNPNISSELKAELGINTTPSAPALLTQPLDLRGEGYENGANKLTWKRNGNSSTTSFLIEYRMGSTATWHLAGMTTKTKYSHNHQTPGVEITYRVTAQRDDLQGLPSQQATIYGPEEAEVVTLKSAA